MTYFIARFPQYDVPVLNPKPEDYYYAALWYRNIMPGKAVSFMRTYRRILWIKGLSIKSDCAERVG